MSLSFKSQQEAATPLSIYLMRSLPSLELSCRICRSPLRRVNPGNDLDWIWFEIWHHEGRRARHGASMMSPGYRHWHGKYEVAKRL